MTLEEGTITAVYAYGNPKDGSMNVIVRTTGATSSGAEPPTQIDTGPAGLVGRLRALTLLGTLNRQLLAVLATTGPSVGGRGTSVPAGDRVFVWSDGLQQAFEVTSLRGVDLRVADWHDRLLAQLEG